MQISIIIPVLNEQLRIAETIARTRLTGECEITVVDGGSTDDTVTRASAADQVLSSPKGRAVQQNSGAQAATGDVLLFLHADCWLEPGSFTEIGQALSDPNIHWGCFRQIIDHASPRYRLVERGNTWRARWLGWVYGDQGLFVRRQTFASLGGFPQLPLMEDLYFSKRLWQTGRPAILGRKLHVDPRRWEKHGIVRQTLRNWAFILRAHCGGSLEQMAREYRDVR